MKSHVGKEIEAHPPKPRLAVRVGFAGTRKGFNPDLPGLRSQFSSVLTEIREIVENIYANDAGTFSADKPRLIFVCALGAGADQFAAQLALDEGYELQVPLAMCRAVYVEANFAGDNHARTTFGILIEQATSVLELDGVGSEDDLYDAAGTVLINHSDLLMAIWDLSAGSGPGGTADSVGKATKVGIPVIAFSSKDSGPAAVSYLKRKDLRPAELRDILQRILSYGIHSETTQADGQEDKPGFDPAEQQRNLQNYYRERERRIDWGFLYSLLIAMIRGAWNVRLQLPAYKESAAENWRELPNEKWVDRAREYFCPLDEWADSLAVFYAQWTRGVVAFTILAGALSVCTSLASKFWQFRWTPLSYLNAVPVLIAAIILSSRRSGVHRRWVEYRMLSELLRNHALCAAIGGLRIDRHRFQSRLGFAPNWVLFYYQAVVRNCGLCSAIFNEDYLEDYKRLLKDRIGGQVQFHTRQEERCTTLSRRIRFFGLFTFSLSLVAPLPGVYTQVAHWLHWRATSVNGIDSVAYLFAVISAAVAGFAAQENFAKLAQVSEAMRKRLSLLLFRIDDIALNSDALRDMAGDSVEITIQEHAEWILLAALHDIELPS